MYIALRAESGQKVYRGSNKKITGHLNKLCASVTLSDALNISHHTHDLNSRSSCAYLHVFTYCPSLFRLSRKVEEKRKQEISLGEQKGLSAKIALSQLPQYPVICFSFLSSTRPLLFTQTLFCPNGVGHQAHTALKKGAV